MATIWLDFPSLDAQVTFTKGPEVLIVDYSDSLAIVLTFVGAASQVLRFSDHTTAAFFQNDLERELLQIGWSFDISQQNPYDNAAVNTFEMPERGTTPAQ